MSFSHLADPGGTPAWQGVLPGRPEPFFLEAGQGEHGLLFNDLFTLLLSGDETQGQFGVFTSRCPAGDTIPTHAHAGTHEVFYVLEGAVRLFVADAEGRKATKLLRQGDFGFVPAGLAHAYRVEEPSNLLGVVSGGFERFPQRMGTRTDTAGEQPPFVPPVPQLLAAASELDVEFLPGYEWPEPGEAPGALT
ncbi:quercetin 2,3-dioxygenase [Kineococcus rubinsiae]|uniref:quercetin 2,3-dioxygenase n=1 Tax=Kineococcus rubinsiae TaxID=2609562 RepID=UPI001430A19A|nr:quercetin 2,3-dioxygenase [Kineococcus rubinsiae]NIZ91773.1 cupin domain-containing protein [Kineococcus rubinsiae]